MNFALHFPILQVLLPLIGAILSALSFNMKASRLIAIAVIAAAMAISINFLGNALPEMSYQLGGWHRNIGIEYRLDRLNQMIIIFMNMVLLSYLVFGHGLTSKLILDQVDSKRRNLFYSLLLFAHAGYIGVVSTNDLFNLYVFIEISSLSTYVLMSISPNRAALIGAFDYLILGTIGATLILIGVGILLASTGTLNMSEVANILSNDSPNMATIYALTFIIFGALLKIALFPMHFWMRRAYLGASSIILTYIAAISSIFSVYIILRFAYFVFDLGLSLKMFQIINPIALLAIFFGGLLAWRSNNIKEVVVYSAMSQIGYILLLVTIQADYTLLGALLVIDSLNKISLFTIIAHIEARHSSLDLRNFADINDSPLFKLLVVLSIIASAGVPLTAMFFIKLKILGTLLEMSLFLEFAIVMFGSLLAILYNFRFAKVILRIKKQPHIIQITEGMFGLILTVIAQISSLVYIVYLL